MADKKFQDVLNQLDRVWGEMRPDFYRSLPSGATEAEIQEAELRLGFPLSEDLRTLYLWHNGEGDRRGGTSESGEPSTAYFQDFVRFFFPKIHAEIDWNQGYDFLDTELQQVVRDAELGKRLTDKLVKVWKLSGEETWVLIHIEIQSQEESRFGERMFVYYYRLRDKYELPIVSLAILGDERETWKPQPFHSELWGCRVQFEFPIIK